MCYNRVMDDLTRFQAKIALLGNTFSKNMRMAKIPKVVLDSWERRSVEMAIFAIQFNIIEEINVLLAQLSSYSPTSLSHHQRQLFSSVKYIMEAVSSLDYLAKHPDEAETYFSDGESIKENVRNVLEDHNLLQVDEKIGKIFRDASRLAGTTLSRIEQTFPGSGLGQYSIVSMFTHVSDAADVLSFRRNEKDYIFLLCQIFQSLSMCVLKFITLTLEVNVVPLASDEAKEITIFFVEIKSELDKYMSISA